MQEQPTGRSLPGWPPLLLSMVVLLACLGYSGTYAFATPFTGLDLDGQWNLVAVASCSDIPGWCAGETQPLRPGDQILAIGHLTLDNYLSDRTTVPFGGYGPGDVVPVLLVREGKALTIGWRMPPLTSRDVGIRLAGLLIYIPFWLLGTAVLFFLRPRDVRWRSLIVVFYLTAIWLAAGSISTSQTAFSSLVLGAATWLMVPAFLHLHLLVPSPVGGTRLRPIVLGLYALASILALLELLQVLPSSWYVLGLFVAVGGSLGLILFRLRRSSTDADKLVSRSILLGVILAFGPGIALWIVPTLTGTRLLALWPSVVTALAVPAMPAFYTYAIFKHQLGDLEFRANWFLGHYSFVLLHVTGFATLFSIGTIWLRSPGETVLLSLILSVAFVAAAPALRARYVRAFGRLVYGARQDPEELARVFASRIPAASDRGALVDLLVEEVMPSLLIHQSAVVLLQDDRPRLLYIRGADVAETELQPRTFESLVGQSGRYRPEGTSSPSAFSWVRLVVPLKVRDKTIGLWLLGRRDPDDYYPRGDIDSLTWMAGQVALAVENSRLYAESNRQTQELGGLYQTARAFGGVMDKQTLLSWVHDEVSRLMVLDRFMVILYDVEREKFHVAFAREAGHPIAVSQAGDLPLSGAAFAQRVLNTSRTVLVRDAESAEPEPGWSDDRPARSWLGVPLLAREKTVGLICVQSFREEAFDDANAHFLEALAGQLATALDNAQLFEETSRRAAHLETVVRFGSALRGAPNRMAMLGIILDQLQVLLGMEAVAAALLDPATGGWSLEMTRGGWHPMASLRIRGDLGAVGSLLAAGATFSTDDVATDPRIEHPEAFGGMTAAAVVPLLAERETVGAVAVGRRRAIASEDIRLLTAITEMAGNALRRAGVMDTLEQRVEERTHELEAANERLKELDALKTDFVSNVSHELRSPITNIVLYLDLLARPFPEEKRTSFLVVLMREALRLGRLIEDLLSLSRMDRDATPAELESHDLDGLLIEVLVAHHAMAVDKGIELNHEPSLNGSPAWIAREQMGQVFHNLIANALAYTPSGGHVSVRILTGGTGEAPLVGVRIHNDGPAIPAEDIPHLFERFFRGKTGRASGESGSGLGLAICQEIVLRHRGWIEVASSEAQGTAFTVWLPSGVEARPA